MVKTLTIGSCVSVQGRLVRNLADGRIVVAVGDRHYTGYPTQKDLAPNPGSNAN